MRKSVSDPAVDDTTLNASAFEAREPRNDVDVDQASLVQMPEFTLGRERALKAALRKRGPDGYFEGGIVAEEVKGIDGELHTIVHMANPYDSNMVIKSFPTRCTKEEIEEIKSKILPTREAYEMLQHIASAYEMRMPLVIEGETALGKTFVVNKFTELLYGPGVKPIDFYCSGQTEVSELTAKWVPKLSTTGEMQKWKKFISTQYGKEKLESVVREVEGADDFSEEERLSLLTSQLQEIAEEAGISSRTQWELQKGAIPRAMTGRVTKDGKVVCDSKHGPGFILKIDEVGLAKPGIVNVILRLRGEQGEVARSIQLWENGGEIIHAGKDFWFVMTTNPPETGYLDRNELDPALARGVLFVRMKDISMESLEMAGKRICSYKIGNAPERAPVNSIIDLTKYPAVGEHIGEVVGAFHHAYVDALKNGEKGGRQQKIPATLDDMSRFARFIMANQIRDTKTGGIDMSATLMNAVETVYLSRLADEELIGQLKDTFRMGLNHEVLGFTNIDGESRTFGELIQSMADEALGVGDYSQEKKKMLEQKRQILAKRREQALAKVKQATETERLAAIEKLSEQRESYANIGNMIRVAEIDQILDVLRNAE